MIATIVDTRALWQTIAAALVAGVGITVVFSIAILGAARVAEASRHGDRLQASVFGALAGLALLLTAAAVVVGVVALIER